jgi:hypothetical protein
VYALSNIGIRLTLVLLLYLSLSRTNNVRHSPIALTLSLHHISTLYIGTFDSSNRTLALASTLATRPSSFALVPFAQVQHRSVVTRDGHNYSREEDDTPLARLPTDFAFSTKSTKCTMHERLQPTEAYTRTHRIVRTHAQNRTHARTESYARTHRIVRTHARNCTHARKQV